MRRYAINAFQCSTRRSGVTASDSKRRRSAQSPVTCVIFSMGLAPRSSRYAATTNHASGMSPRRRRNDVVAARRLAKRTAVRTRASAPAAGGLEVLPQVHAGIQSGHLLGVTVERQGGAAAKLA